MQFLCIKFELCIFESKYLCKIELIYHSDVWQNCGILICVCGSAGVNILDLYWPTIPSQETIEIINEMQYGFLYTCFSMKCTK